MRRVLMVGLLCMVLALGACGAVATATPIATEGAEGPAVASSQVPAIAPPSPQPFPQPSATHRAWLPYAQKGSVEPAPVVGYRMVRAYPHDAGAFTQGLVYVDGEFIESTGLYGRSSLRRAAIDSGKVLARVDLPAERFGEGIAVWRDRVIQLTWRSGVGTIYALSDLAPLREFAYWGEGWGLTHDGTRLIMSDGSSTLRFLDPESLAEIGRMPVSDAGSDVPRLNELEYIEGEVWANVWLTDRIVCIDPNSGRVLRWVDLSGLLKPEDVNQPVDVLNGIAYDPIGQRVFVTGKLWPKVFEITIDRYAPTASAAGAVYPGTR